MIWHDTATILRAQPETDTDTGEATGGLTWVSATPVATVCSIQPLASREAVAGGGETVVGAWFGYFPPATDLRSADRVQWRGRTLTVDGEVAPWVVRGTVHHLEVPLRDVS